MMTCDSLRSLLQSAVWLLVGILLVPLPASAQSDDPNTVFDPSLYADMEYRMIGPYRGGRVTAVAGIASDPDTYLMGATGGGVWKTTNAGQDWHNISDGHFDVSSIGAIHVAPSDPNVIYVGTGTACLRGNIQIGNGVYKSTDGGKTWTDVGLDNVGQIGKLKIHPTNPDVAYVAALGQPFGSNPERGVYRTTNGGETWEKVLFVSNETGAVDLALNPKNPRILYAGTWTVQRSPWTLESGSDEGAIYKSTDGGSNWTRLEGGLPQDLVGKTAVTVSPVNPDRVWALVEAPEPKGGLYRSDDAGSTWTQVNTDRRHQQRAWYYTHIYADPQDENTVYSLNTAFYKSVDGGKTFESYRVPHGDVHDLWIHPDDPKQMVVGNDGGGQVTVDGAETWSTYFNQPTAEMYSVTVDSEFPYHVYGPQQDNSTIRVPAWNEGSIHPKSDWTYVGGCETGPVALHDDRPWLVYSGCYGGSLTRWNERTGQSRNVMVYPQLQLGQAPRDLRERFQWNAPIVVSPHNPDVIYHASQRIWKSTDQGMSWTAISDDLTTDTAEHQDFAGEPITKDNTGVEVFNTVYSLVVSPHDANTLWAGTDDGRIWISQNGGDQWTEITPDDLPQFGTVNRLEVSPHTPGTAYAAVHKYRLDDWAPYIFKTTNGGDSWELLTDGENGIPSDDPVHVVREDPDREGLLYAGTEFGLYASFNDGENWQSLQQNLPVTRVADLQVKHQDLIVATHGRSFWIMDDLTPLHQMTQSVAESDAHLFAPRPAHLVSPASGGDHENREPEGRGAPATIHFSLAEVPDTTMTLEIVDPQGDVFRHFTTDSTTAADEHAVLLEPSEGLNRVTWNLTGTPVDVVDDAVVWGYLGGPRAVPGAYAVRMSIAGEATQTQTLEVRMDPRVNDVTADDLRDSHNLAVAIRDTLNEVYSAVRTIRSVREQMHSVAEHAEEAGLDADLMDQATATGEKLSAIEKELMQVKNQSNQDPLNYPPMLDNQIAYLYGYVASPDGPPTEGARQRFDDVMAQWAEQRSALQTVLDEDVAAFNQAVRDLGTQPVFVPTSSN